DRAVGAVDRELVALERAARAPPEREIRAAVDVVATIVDEPASAAAPERQHDLVVVFAHLAGASVGDHRAGDRLGARRRGQVIPPVASSIAYEILAGLS